MATNYRIETPSNLDAIFSLECFKYLEMKGLFQKIYLSLDQHGECLDNLSNLKDLPDVETI